MCKYRYGTGKYGKGRCAHPSNLSIDCVGEDSCRMTGDEVMPRDSFDTIGGYDRTNTEKEDSCPNTTCGIYCQKYNRFYCAGEENCQTEEEYKNHMNMDGGL